MTPDEVAAGAARKGLGLVSTGDFLHPCWRSHLAETLTEAGEPGFYRMKEARGDVSRVRFVAGCEVNCVWRQGGRGHRVHLLLYVPSLGEAGKLAKALERHGRLVSDGRPTLRLSCSETMEVSLDAVPETCIVAAHAFTPWYGLLGGRSGFDSVAEALGPMAGTLCALETGLSCDPWMARRIAALDPYPMVSFSDAHSPESLGREATAFSRLGGFGDLAGALRSGIGIESTLEFFPAEGKYHLDGHRGCKVRFSPGEAPPDGRCPVCGKPLTPGVLGRIHTLADRPEAYRSPGGPKLRHAIPLADLAAQALGGSAKSPAVRRAALLAADEAGGEIQALLDAPLECFSDPRIAAAVEALRAGRVAVEPGYDGRYGRVTVAME
jgi:uncharacterized protein (TIGR00375 family)